MSTSGNMANRLQHFSYGGELIRFERLTRPKAGKLLIKVHPDCRVEVMAPPQTPDEEVLAAVKNVPAGSTNSCVTFVSSWNM